MSFNHLVHPALGGFGLACVGRVADSGDYLFGAVPAPVASDYGSSSAADARWGYYRVNGNSSLLQTGNETWSDDAYAGEYWFLYWGSGLGGVCLDIEQGD